MRMAGTAWYYSSVMRSLLGASSVQIAGYEDLRFAELCGLRDRAALPTRVVYY